MDMRTMTSIINFDDLKNAFTTKRPYHNPSNPPDRDKKNKDWRKKTVYLMGFNLP